MPDEVGFAEAAAFSVSFLTAWYAMHELGRAREGESVVVSAAAGGVGTSILQLAKLVGLDTMAVIGSPAKRDLALEMGAGKVSERIARHELSYLVSLGPPSHGLREAVAERYQIEAPARYDVLGNYSKNRSVWVSRLRRHSD